MKAVERWAKRVLVAAAAALLFAGCGGGSSGGGTANTTVKSVALNGAQENPAVTTAAVGNGFITVDLDTGAVSGSVNTFGITGSAAHIHEAAAGVNGPVIVPLAEGPAGTWTVPEGSTLTAAQVQSFRDGNLYVNVHTAANPGGEIRGQIGKQIFFATLTGAQETPPVTTQASGVARIVFDPQTRALSGTATTSGLTGTAAHIHTAPVGTAGGVTIPLTGGPANWSVPAGTVLTETQVNDLSAGNLYVNVHSSANPGGEIRGQLFLPAKSANLTGAQETPPNNSQATGFGVLMVNPFTKAVAGRVETTGVSGTAAHVHQAAAGVAGGVVIPLTTPGSGAWVTSAGATLSDALLAAFMTGNLYFNVHSAAFPGGEIRGQLVAGQ